VGNVPYEYLKKIVIEELRSQEPEEIKRESRVAGSSGAGEYGRKEKTGKALLSFSR
jgi:hypothetical protein